MPSKKTILTSNISLPEIANYPEKFIQAYKDAGYWQAQTFIEALEMQVNVTPDNIAITENNNHVTYSELLKHIQLLANGLQSLGLQQGDTVIVHLPNSIYFIEVCFALFQLGVYPVLALPAHKQLEINNFCQFTQAKAYITNPALFENNFKQHINTLQANNPSLQHIIVSQTSSPYLLLSELYIYPALTSCFANMLDLACFQLSGGTTGIPKLIPRRHCEYLYNIKASAALCQFNEQTTYLTALPMQHNFTLSSPGFMGTLLSGGRVVITNQAAPSDCFPLIKEQQVTHTSLVPPLALLWLEAQRNNPADLSSLKLLQIGGAKLLNSVASQITPVLGCKLQQVFGMAEGLICYTRLTDSPEIINNTQGKPLSPSDEIRIVDQYNTPVPLGQAGLLQVRGPYTIRGYFNAPEHNAKSFTPDGFYCSGDIVKETAEGYLIVEGRDKDQINRGGEKIVAEEIENLLILHPQIHDAVIVSMQDKLMGELTCAFIIAHTNTLSSLMLKKYLKEQGLASFKIPDKIKFIKQFPQTGIGKISRKQLREALKTQYLK